MYSVYAYEISFHSTCHTLTFLDNSSLQFRLTQNILFYYLYPIVVEITNPV